MQGGGTGAKGVNYWVKRAEKEDGEGFEERWVNMGPKNMVSMKEGDRCVIHTPGGGGWGSVEDSEWEVVEGEKARVQYPRASGSVAATVNAQAESN